MQHEAECNRAGNCGGKSDQQFWLGVPGLVRLDPRWYQAALRFVVSGFWHIIEGIDHLLFLCCLVIPFRRLRPLVIIVTSFTVGHSISLIASAFGFVPDALWFPPLTPSFKIPFAGTRESRKGRALGACDLQ